jgi:hypothetical protein
VKRSGVFWLALLFLLPSVPGCDSVSTLWPRIPWYWKTYEHPTYRFSIRVPRTWKVESSGVMEAQVVLLASEDDLLFRANANVMVQRAQKRSLLQEAAISLQQLRLLMNEYELLSEAPTRLGDLPAHEIRGRYRGAEGSRILRTIIGIQGDREYVFTFTCREERETVFQPLVREMIRSFHAPGSLSGPS